MLPRFPQQLRRIDADTLGEHSLLSPTDCCYHLWEYTPRARRESSADNCLIRNLKIGPAILARRPSRLRYKHAAIAHAGRALRRLVPRGLVESHATFVPMPCSRTGAERDDRLLRVLACAFHGWHADVRELLWMRGSMRADHESPVRSSRAQLLRVMGLRADDRPPRALIFVVDDILNSGKHFKVAQSLLGNRYRGTPVRGLFLARCIRVR